MPHIELSAHDHIPGLSEREILPAKTEDSYNNFMVFPAESLECIPKRFQTVKQNLPRFSMFAADEVFLNGFRLFRIDNHHFTDTSLISLDLAMNSKNFEQKISGRQSEDINFNRLESAGDNFVDVRRDGSILLPCSDEPSNFGSWIYRFLPKLVMSSNCSEFEAVLVYQQPWMTELVRLIGIDCELIKHQPTLQHRVSRPLIPSLPVPNIYFRREVRECLGALHERQEDSRKFGERIYVSRRAQAIKNPLFRALENETGLIAALREIGFVEFMPEKFSIQQQIGIFDQAKIVVGCGGSNMFGAIFARNAELIVDIESCDEWSGAHANLLASTKARWSMVKGRQLTRGSKPHLNWTLDIESFLFGLNALLSK